MGGIYTTSLIAALAIYGNFSSSLHLDMPLPIRTVRPPVHPRPTLLLTREEGDVYYIVGSHLRSGCGLRR